MRHANLAATAICLSLSLGAAVAAAQCPDGSPPPCLSRTVQRAAVAVPAANERSRRFLILPFRNVTRRADQDWLVEGSTTMLVESLGRWQGITVVPDEKLYPALKRAGIEAGTVVDAPRVRRLSEETGGWTAVTGEVIATGGRLRITARAWDVPTNREVVRASGEVSLDGDVRVAFDSVGLRLLRSVGLDSVTPDLVAATTQNVDAYRSYLRGVAHMRRSEVKSALTDFQEAVRADSGFALAWARLSDAQAAAEPVSIFNPANRAAQYAARALALSAKLPPRHRQLVAARDASFRAQFTEVRGILEALLATDSTDLDAMERLVALEMFDPQLVPTSAGPRPRGSYTSATRLAKQIVTLDPTRRATYGMLAGIYAQAGVPGATPALAVDRPFTSLQDLMQLVQQRQHVRVFYPLVMADSFVLVPAESLSSIPKDSLDAMRRRARATARSWAERWVATSTDEAAPLQLVSELYALDGEYAAALHAVAKAESLGVQTPSWSPPARRLLFQAKAGDLATAGRLADSLTSAGFFGNPNNMLINGDVAAWSFGLHLLAGRLSAAGTLIDQYMALMRMIAPGTPLPDFAAVRTMMGNEDPADEPRIPREFRARQVDSALAHLAEWVKSERVGPWVPMILPMLAEAADTSKRRVRALLPAADALARTGRDTAAFELASNAVASDSTLAPSAAAFPWYVRGAEALRALRLETQSRFTPASAVVTAERATFEWRVNDAAPFPRNRRETPVGRAEYRWDVELPTADRYYRLVAAAAPKLAASPQSSGSLAELLPPAASRSIVTGKKRSDGTDADTTGVQGVAVLTEFASGVFRMVVTDPTVLAWLRRERPSAARFRFYPCAETMTAAKECVDARVTIDYR